MNLDELIAQLQEIRTREGNRLIGVVGPAPYKEEEGGPEFKGREIPLYPLRQITLTPQGILILRPGGSWPDEVKNMV